MWTHLTNGDDWHRKRFAEAYHAKTNQETPLDAFGWGAAAGVQAITEGTGGTPAQDWARERPGFTTARNIGLVTMTAELALVTGGTSVGFTAPVAIPTLYAAAATAPMARMVSQGMAEVTLVSADFTAANLNNPHAPDFNQFAQNATVAGATGMLGHLPTVGWRNLQWGRNRLIKEMLDRGFVYVGPTNSGNGRMYRNASTGEEIRIMPRPTGSPHRGEPSEKFSNDYYYRYRSGPDAPWEEHTPLPNPK